MPCDNDCFYCSHSTFKKADETYMRLQINSYSYSQSEPCPSGGISDTKPRYLCIFEIKSSEYGYELIKVINK